MVRNCTVVGNITSNNSYAAGIAVAISADDVEIENTIVAGNIHEGPGNSDKHNWSGSNGIFSYTCVGEGAAPAGEECFVADPLFVDSDVGDYRLMPESPCVNIGKTDVAMFGATDLAGKQRVRQRKIDLSDIAFGGGNC